MTDVMSVVELDMELVYANPQDRKHFGEAAIAELAESIRLHGLAQPITVRPDGAGFYLIVAGERRFKAHQHLGLGTIRAIVSDLSDEQASGVQLIENVQRVDLDPYEEAMAYRSRMDRFDMDVEDIARWAGKSPNHVSRRLELLALADEIVTMLRSGQLLPAYAQTVCRLDVNRQRLAIKALGQGRGLSFFQFDKLCDQLLDEQMSEPLFDPDAFLQVAEYQDQARQAAKARVADAMVTFVRLRPLVEANVDDDELYGLPEGFLAEAMAMIDYVVETRNPESKVGRKAPAARRNGRQK